MMQAKCPGCGQLIFNVVRQRAETSALGNNDLHAECDLILCGSCRTVLGAAMPIDLQRALQETLSQPRR